MVNVLSASLQVAFLLQDAVTTAPLAEYFQSCPRAATFPSFAFHVSRFVISVVHVYPLLFAFF